VTLTNGLQLADKVIYGDIRLPSQHTQDIILRNCKLRGGPHIPSSNDAVVKADSTRSSTGRLILVDCEISPQKPALNRDGLRGNRWWAFRTYCHDTIDGFFGYALTTQNNLAGQVGAGVADVRAMGCITERLRYGFPDYRNGVSGTDPATYTWGDPTPSDWEHNNGTHNDNFVLGSKGVWAKGNLFRGTSVDLAVGEAMPSGAVIGQNPEHPQIQASGYSFGQNVLITYTGSQCNSTSIFEENWLYGANAHISVIDGNTGTAVIQNNRHYREVFVGSTSSGYWIRYPPGGGTEAARAAAYPATTDRWVNGPYSGNLLTTPRDLGISVG
jgi:hypothetical protein